MRLQTKIIIIILPLIFITVLGLGGWSYNVAQQGAYANSSRYLQVVVQEYISSQLIRRSNILEKSGVGQVVSYIEKYQQEAIESARLMPEAQNGHFFALNKRGEFIFSSLNHDVTKLESTWKSLAQRTILSPQAAYQGRIANQDYRVLYYSKYFEPWEWVVFFAIDSQNIEESISQILLTTIGVASLAAIVAVIAIILFFQKFLLSPIHLLKQATAQIAHQQPIDSVGIHSNDELGKLARDIEVMSLAIQKHNQQQSQLQSQLSRAKSDLEDRVKERTAELQEANTTKNKFFSIISHDLKSPLNSLCKLTEFLAEDIEEMNQKEIVDFSQRIHSSAIRLQDFLDNLLRWSQIQGGGGMASRPQEVDLHEISQDVFALLSENAISKKIHLLSTILPQTLVIADMDMLEVVLQNLISNAIKFTPSMGTVTLAATPSQQANHMMEISVTDTGIGIPKNHLNKLFRIDVRYSSLGTEGEKGTGLGLVICKEFVKKQGGEIWVESREEEEPPHPRGTTFTLTLPLIPFSQ